MNNTETYVNSLQPAHNFIDKNPELIHQRRALAVHQNKGQRFVSADEVETTIGTVIHNAGMTFLESIHQEIQAAKPEWQKSLEQDQQEIEAVNEDKKNIAAVINP